jgi:uncharacterized protein YodC (DUF2158 family)
MTDMPFKVGDEVVDAADARRVMGVAAVSQYWVLCEWDFARQAKAFKPSELKAHACERCGR